MKKTPRNGAPAYHIQLKSREHPAIAVGMNLRQALFPFYIALQFLGIFAETSEVPRKQDQKLQLPRLLSTATAALIGVHVS